MKQSMHYTSRRSFIGNIAAGMTVVAFIICLMPMETWRRNAVTASRVDEFWRPPSLASIVRQADSSLIRYGRDLIMHTARYLGPNGSVGRAVASTYPKSRNCSGSSDGVERSINDCLRSGDSLDHSSYADVLTEIQYKFGPWGLIRVPYD